MILPTSLCTPKAPSPSVGSDSCDGAAFSAVADPFADRRSGRPCIDGAADHSLICYGIHHLQPWGYSGRVCPPQLARITRNSYPGCFSGKSFLFFKDPSIAYHNSARTGFRQQATYHFRDSVPACYYLRYCKTLQKYCQESLPNLAGQLLKTGIFTGEKS